MSDCPPGTHEYTGFPGAGSRCIHCHKLIGDLTMEVTSVVDSPEVVVESAAVKVYKELISYVKHLTSCPCYRSLDHQADCSCGAFEAVLAAHALAWPVV